MEKVKLEDVILELECCDAESESYFNLKTGQFLQCNDFVLDREELLALQNDLFYEISGRGAFRHFKDKVNLLGIEEKWYAFRDQAYREIAIQWCKENHLSYE
ncbi:hypothetical protein Hs30E_05450 [Lactococcus hodotermopsidis]|uniref:Uncharacterized protein n=1 Tax=Pseudolactococcus hodotermopsidis TaxID=2709157 RepID=A0A6A0BC60_9LACT|nr:UPF0158 family protein [Lactococcus hodotermopsidis]GFH41994.1 hypothetical protein Hs30E_05450 [Lactococcus hodotermopsidis]